MSRVDPEDVSVPGSQPPTKSAAEPMNRKFLVSSEYRSCEDLESAGKRVFKPDSAFLNVFRDGYFPFESGSGTGEYGKTEKFRLPIIALASKSKCRHVSFAFVPYTAILADAKRRLKTKIVVRVNDAKHFIELRYDGTTDVYVCVFDYLAQTHFALRIANLIQANSRRPEAMQVKLGYAIMGRFRNFYIVKISLFEPAR